MKHNALTALSLAAALVVAGSAKATEFEIDFETVEGTDYALSPANGWTVQTGDASEVADAPSPAPSGFTLDSKVLSLDTGDEELIYTPTSTDVSILTMDVCFVAADEAPTIDPNFDGQTMIYLDSSENLKADVAGTWTTVLTGVSEGWHSLTMTFDYSEAKVTFTLDNGTPSSAVAFASTPATAFSKVNSVGFKGTGMVDNFVGEAAPVAGPEAWTFDGTTSNKVEGVTVASGVVTTTFTDTNLKFIRYYNGNDFVTLRYTDTQNNVNVGFDPTKIVAFYGGNVTATDGITPEATNVAVDNGTVTVTFTAKSGVYYWLKDVSDNSSLAGTATAIAPNAEGVITLTFDADSHAWGVKKFQLVVDDNPPPAAAGN